MASEPEAQSAASKQIQATLARALLPQRASRAELGGFRFFGDRPAEPVEPDGDGAPEDGGEVEKDALPEARLRDAIVAAREEPVQKMIGDRLARADLSGLLKGRRVIARRETSDTLGAMTDDGLAFAVSTHPDAAGVMGDGLRVLMANGGGA